MTDTSVLERIELDVNLNDSIACEGPWENVSCSAGREAAWRLRAKCPVCTVPPNTLLQCDGCKQQLWDRVKGYGGYTFHGIDGGMTPCGGGIFNISDFMRWTPL